MTIICTKRNICAYKFCYFQIKSVPLLRKVRNGAENTPPQPIGPCVATHNIKHKQTWPKAQAETKKQDTKPAKSRKNFKQ